MKKIAIIMSLIVLCGTTAMAQKKSPSEQSATIKIPSYCCNGLTKTIENTLAYEKGVVKWSLDQPNKQITVVYKDNKTNPQKIEKALANNGVMTEHEQPNPKAIDRLPACCRPAARGEEKCGTM